MIHRALLAKRAPPRDRSPSGQYWLTMQESARIRLLHACVCVIVAMMRFNRSEDSQRYEGESPARLPNKRHRDVKARRTRRGRNPPNRYRLPEGACMGMRRPSTMGTALVPTSSRTDRQVYTLGGGVAGRGDREQKKKPLASPPPATTDIDSAQYNFPCRASLGRTIPPQGTFPTAPRLHCSWQGRGGGASSQPMTLLRAGCSPVFRVKKSLPLPTELPRSW